MLLQLLCRRVQHHRSSSTSVVATINFSRHPSPVIIVRCRYHPPTPVSEDHQPSSVVILNYARLPIIVAAIIKFYSSLVIVDHHPPQSFVFTIRYRRRRHLPLSEDRPPSSTTSAPSNHRFPVDLKMSHRSVCLSVCIL